MRRVAITGMGAISALGRDVPAFAEALRRGCGGIGVGNRFERAADRYAASGRGWWPWSNPGNRADERLR